MQIFHQTNSEKYNLIPLLLLIIIVVFSFFQFINNKFLKTEDEKSKDYITSSLKGMDYENILAGYYGSVASVEAEHWKRPPSSHVSTVLHPTCG